MESKRGPYKKASTIIDYDGERWIKFSGIQETYSKGMSFFYRRIDRGDIRMIEHNLVNYLSIKDIEEVFRTKKLNWEKN